MILGVASHTLWQSYDFLCDTEVTDDDMHKSDYF